jgi:hypothetical protein
MIHITKHCVTFNTYGMKTTKTLSHHHVALLSFSAACNTHQDNHIYIYIYIKWNPLTRTHCSLCYTCRRTCGSTTKMKLTTTQQPSTQYEHRSHIRIWSNRLLISSGPCLRLTDQATLPTPVIIGRKYLPLNPVSGTHRSQLDVTYLLPTLPIPVSGGCGWRMPALGQCCQVCELRTADLVAFYTWQSLLHATALPIDELHLEMGTAKSALSLCNWPRPNKQFHSTHTFSYSPVLRVD